MAKKIEVQVEKTKATLKDFQGFLLRGNLVDLAVAVVIGAAFTSIVKSFTSTFVTPLIAALFGGKVPFAEWSFTINGQAINYGTFLNDLVTFFITCAVVFFFLVKPVGALMRRMGYAPPDDPHRAPCPFCLSDVVVAATRCPYCTSDLGQDWSTPPTR